MYYAAWSLFKRTLHISFLEGAPENANAQEITEYLLKNVSGIEKITHIHIWMITSGRSMATLHVKPKDGVDLSTLTLNIENELKSKFSIGTSNYSH